MRPPTLSAWSVGTRLAAPGLRVMLSLRAWCGKEVGGRLGERRGIERAPRPPGELVWVHAASVGETFSVLPVLEEIAAIWPEVLILLTTGTVTSSALVGQRLPELGLRERVLHRFAPLDVPQWASRFLDHWRPKAAAFVESELWPNLLAGCARRDIPVMLVNARMSERSYARWRRAPRTARAVLAGFCRIAARSEGDAARLRSLGAENVSTLGDLKFAAPPLAADRAELSRLQGLLDGRPLWLAASTHPGEEEIVLDAHGRLSRNHPGLITIIAPRHPDRGAAIAALAGTLASRRALGQDPRPGGIWIADTLGELGLLYRLARIALIGRSLLPPGGGQNPLEPARLGCAVAVGPHTDNFAAAVAALQDAGGIARVSDAAGLAAWVDSLLQDPGRRDAMGAAGRASIAGTADLPRRMAQAIVALARG